MKRLIYTFIVLFTLSGCADNSSIEVYNDTRKQTEEWDGSSISQVTSKYFITEYVTITKIRVNTNVDGCVDLRLGGNCYSTLGGKDYEHYEKILYFSELYGDTNYDKKVSGWAHTALAYPIEKMSIRCDKDFDAEHPAGVPLDDIVNLDFSTYDKFIKSGYKSLNDNPWWYDKEEELFLLPFESVNADVTRLAKVILEVDCLTNSWNNFFARFRFGSTPETPGEYTFTLEMVVNGKTFSTEFTHTFE